MLFSADNKKFLVSPFINVILPFVYYKEPFKFCLIHKLLLFHLLLSCKINRDLFYINVCNRWYFTKYCYLSDTLVHLLASLSKSTQTFPAFTEAVLEAEGQIGSKGSWVVIGGATRPTLGGYQQKMTGFRLRRSDTHTRLERTLLPMAASYS